MASSGAMTSSGADLVTSTVVVGGGGGVLGGGGGEDGSSPNVLHFPNLQNRFGIVGTVTSKVLEQTSLSVHFFLPRNFARWNGNLHTFVFFYETTRLQWLRITNFNVGRAANSFGRSYARIVIFGIAISAFNIVVHRGTFFFNRNLFFELVEFIE